MAKASTGGPSLARRATQINPSTKMDAAISQSSVMSQTVSAAMVVITMSSSWFEVERRFVARLERHVVAGVEQREVLNPQLVEADCQAADVNHQRACQTDCFRPRSLEQIERYPAEDGHDR